MGDLTYSFELYEYQSSIEDGQIVTTPPNKTEITVDDFCEGEHFRTQCNDDRALTLKIDDRFLSLIIDESGSMTWNDNPGDRYTYFKRLLSRLKSTYPDTKVNIIGFGGTLTNTTTFIARAGVSNTVSVSDFDKLLLDAFQNSVYDFAGVRVVRRTYDSTRGSADSITQYPQDPNDGDVVAEGIFQSIKDENLTEGTNYYYGIWSYNKVDHESSPTYVRAFPYDRDLPEGVHFSDARVRVLTGITPDDYTQLIFNLQERSGNVLLDSSGNGRHGILFEQSVQSNFWSGDSAISSYTVDGLLKTQVGVRFDGERDLVEVVADSNLAVTPSQSITVCFWCYRYSNASDEWIIGTSTELVSNNIGWAIGLTSNGYICFQDNTLVDGFTTVTNAYVVEKEWTHVSVVLTPSSLTVYLNKIQADQISVAISDGSAMDILYIGSKPTYDGATWPGTDYFGCLSNLSVSNTVRSLDSISELYDFESTMFNESILDSSALPIDNGHREVIIKWVVGDAATFLNGKVRVVRKFGKPPAHDEDGTIIYDNATIGGENTLVDTHEFIHGSNYFYRIFTYKEVEPSKYLVCDRNDARLLSVTIPKVPHVSDFARPASVSSVVTTPADRKIMLEWINPSEDYSGTKIFVGTDTYPTVSYTTTGVDVVGGYELVDTTLTHYIHRSMGRSADGSDMPLVNGKIYYYTLVTYNNYGVFSNTEFTSSSPSDALDPVMDPAEVSDFHVIVVNPTTLSLQWKNPIVKSEQITIYMGETALLYTSVRDTFGGIPDDVTNMSYEIWASYNERTTDVSDVELGYDPHIIEDISNKDFAGEFPIIEMSESLKDEINLSYGVVGSGLLKGTLGHTTDSQVLVRREKYTMIARAKYKIVDPITSKDVFVFNSEPVRVDFINPIKMAIVNKHNRKVQPQRGGDYIKGDVAVCECSKEPGDSSTPPLTSGVYCNSTRPYVARIELQFKGTSLPDGYPVNVSIWRTIDRKSKPTHVSIREGVYQSNAIELQDPNEHLVSKSYVDVEIPVPTMPETIYLYATATYNGFTVDGFHEIVFIGGLFVDLDCRKPITDGTHSEEQFASVYMIHPDYPDDPSMRLLPPDGTLVKWSIAPRKYGKSRPFYSTAKMSEFLSGVYSPTRNGIARDVFFGPIGPDLTEHQIQYSCDGEPEQCCLYEDYIITAEVAIGELSAIDQYVLAFECDTPQTQTSQRLFINAASDWTQNTGHNPEWVTWADGIHMLKFQIAHNPSDPNCPVPGADCFVECVKSLNPTSPIYTLQPGTIVSVTAPGEILWNVSFYDDPYSSLPVIADIGNIISAKIAEDQGVENVAKIKIGYGDATDFYVRMNASVDNNPHEQELPQSGGSGLSDLTNENGLLPNEWEGICFDAVDSCTLPVKGKKWDEVYPIVASANIIVQVNDQQVETRLFGGGGYDNGIPPLLVGFKEPLQVDIVEIRTSVAPYRHSLVIETDKKGKPTGRVFLPLQELADKGYITFVLEVSFAGEIVPDNVPVEIETSGIVELASCTSDANGCYVSTSGIVRVKNINDPYLNPGSVTQRSLAYFTINPISSTQITNGNVSVGTDSGSLGYVIATVDYDKRGDLEEE